MNEPLSDFSTIKSTDLRSALNVAPATFNELLRKHDIHAIKRVGRGASKDIPADQVRKLLEIRGFQFPDEAKVISLMMCKGGVGKTTSTLFLSKRLASYGARVLAIDADSQGNLTSAFNLEQLKFEVDEETPILVDVVTGDATIDEAIIAVTPNLHIIPSNPLNATLEGKIRDNFKNPSIGMAKHLKSIKDRYDYIIFDCAPALNLTNTAIIGASNMVILPATPDKFSKMGLEQTITEIETIEKDFGLNVDVKVVFTKFDGREFTSLKYLSEIADEYKDSIFKTMVRTAADLKNAITKKEDLFDYKKSNAKEDYDNLAKELMGIQARFKK